MTKQVIQYSFAMIASNRSEQKQQLRPKKVQRYITVSLQHTSKKHNQTFTFMIVHRFTINGRYHLFMHAKHT